MLFVRISDTSEVRRFIRDLKQTLKLAEQTGGGHSCFLHRDEGAIFQLEVAPLVRSKK